MDTGHTLASGTAARADAASAGHQGQPGPQDRPSPRQQLGPGGSIYLPLQLLRTPLAETPPTSLRAWEDDQVATLILTDYGQIQRLFGLAATDPAMGALRARVQALAAHEAVAGRVVWELGTQTDARVAAAFAAWVGNTDPARWTVRANSLALALHDWIGHERSTRHPSLRSVLIIGDDRIVPHLRLRIDAPFGQLDDGWVSETAYFQENTLTADSAVGTALAEDMTLTDDAYGAGASVTWGPRGLDLYVPDLAVGRLVERPADIVSAIDVFLRSDGRLTVGHSLTACYDFMRDACEASDDLLVGGGLPASAQRRLVGNNWTVDHLRAALAGDFDLFFYGVHAKHYVHETPHNGILYAADLAGLLGAPGHARLAYGLACHAGLNAPGDHPEPIDFPEVMTAAGVNYVASTGWAYGFDGQMQYQEKLLAGLTHEIVSGAATNLGDAWAGAKRGYFRDAGAIDHLHAKTLAGTLLYGLPMTRVRVGAATGGS